VVAGRPTYAVERFVEKPSAERAVELIATGMASWNAGIFAWTRATIRDRLARYAPDIVGPIRAISRAGTPADLDAAYPSLRATSIDYAVMEPASVAGDVSVVPMSVGWSDLGSWAALRDAWRDAAAASTASTAGPALGTDQAAADAGIGLGNRRDIGSRGSLVLAGDRLVVTIGLNDVIVVDTPEAVLVCSAEHSQDVRRIAEELAGAGRGASKQGEES
jgi:mannose-1-phosphate guanylyltransferase